MGWSSMKIEEALAGVRSPGIEASPFIYFAASAVLARCEAFLTNDHDLRRVTGRFVFWCWMTSSFPLLMDSGQPDNSTTCHR